MSRIHDISVPLRTGGLVYPGNPEIAIELQQSVADGASANVSTIRFGSHTGTHVDSARHFFDNAEAVDEIELDILLGPALVLSFDDSLMSIRATDLEMHDLRGHIRVLLRTRNSAFLMDKRFHSNYTYLAPDGAEYLVSKGVRLVGIDYLSIEQFHSGHHRTHRTLLESRVVIVEGLNLHNIRDGEYDFVCLPLRLEGLDGAPARTVLIER